MEEDILKKCAIAFKKLLDVEYHIILGRKCKRYDIKLIFRPEDFHHLAGLKYLSDVKSIQTNRERVFKNILDGKLTYKDIENSIFLPEMIHKITYLYLLEDLLDKDEVIFNFDKGKRKKCHIPATYLINNTPIDRELYFFIDKEIYKNELIYYGLSFFPKADDDYTINQIKMTLLQKTKYSRKSMSIIDQYTSPKFIEDK